MSTPVRSGYYGVGVGVADGVGVAAAQAKSDSRRFPGRSVLVPVIVVRALRSVQVPEVSTVNCWLPFGLTLNAVTVNVPQLKFAVSIPGGITVPTWLLTKCQVPFPLHVAPISLVKSAARAGVTN